ncbi:hypothetical protein BD324DRAFT_652135 [Kockovaella imperatae]|uniref:Uncharacterized protein n=1 Tax=Kockovaella imperatae TaxID=4999 RepID=A0A1Y1UDJ1_9TREE|nr:hypothetical protein BD324DRAFT_652135 [Kockovaella imperatae]ORX35586.1 hypothetical protein BD324DRAFT_652135 [Kockovaella imperatae]
MLRRPTSRTSSTTHYSSDGMAPSSLTSGTSGTSRTSLTSWMDRTELAEREDDKEELLIDMSDDAPVERVERVEQPSPAEKLKLLLRQMDAEIRETGPANQSGPSRTASGWREKRMNGDEAREEEEEEEDDSPPTPPRRIPSTRMSQHVPSRAAVLRASKYPQEPRQSTSRSPEPSHPTPLETYIARTSSRSSLDQSVSSTSSRKGKERAHDSPKSLTPARSRVASGRTPRRWDVELAPPADEFAEYAEDLEVRGHVELDLEEESGDPPPWESETSGDEREEWKPPPPPPATEIPRPSPDRTPLRRVPHASPNRWRDTSLPALPQPSDLETDEEQELVSRRTNMFRSPKTVRPLNRFAHLSKGSAAEESFRPTPHPPGRFTPRNELVETVEDVSVHRIKLSPAKSKPLPPLPRSQTFAQAQEALRQASQASDVARLRVESAQRQWLDALATAQKVGDGALIMAKKGWTWSSWAWWVSIEVLLVWGVFRVTLDYAQSTAFLASIDPFSPLLSPTRHLAMAVPNPSSLSIFAVPHRGSANFFDLVERAHVWKFLHTWDSATLGDEVRMLGGVPT